MVERQLNEFFAEEGYVGIPSNLPEFTIYFQMEHTYVNVFHVVYYRSNLYISKDQYLHIKEKIRNLFLEKGISQIHILSLIVCDDGNKARQLCADDTMSWIINPYENRLMIFENQVSNFYGMRDKLEYFLTHLEDGEQTENISGAEAGKHKIPIVTAVLVMMNVLIFLLCTFTGDLLYNRGALSLREVLADGQFYRLFTSMFLHWDAEHLFSNMIVLYYVGAIVERELGALPYMALYLLSGLVGNLFSVGYYELFVNIYGSSAGASGAVFGVEGALLFLVMIRRGRLESMTLGRVAFAVAFSLYCGFTSAGVNNAAHVGGVLMGFTAAAVIAGCKKMRQLFDHRSR